MIYRRSIFPQPMRKIGTNVELFNVPTYQCSNVADLSLLRQFLGNNCAHVILTGEADKLATDAKRLLEDYGLVGRRNNLSVHARIDSTWYVRDLWESREEDDKNTHAAIIEVKFGIKKSRRSNHRYARANS